MSMRTNKKMNRRKKIITRASSKEDDLASITRLINQNLHLILPHSVSIRINKIIRQKMYDIAVIDAELQLIESIVSTIKRGNT